MIEPEDTDGLSDSNSDDEVGGDIVEHRHESDRVASPTTNDDARRGLGAVPILGPVFDGTRRVFDGLQPQKGDSLGITIGKRSLQGAVVVGAAGAAAVCVF